MRRTILPRGNNILHTPSAEITDFAAIGNVITDLRGTLDWVETRYNFTRAHGIAAPQIGALIRVSVIRYQDKEYVLGNPVIVENSGVKEEIREGCLSFFEERGSPERFTAVTVDYQDEEGAAQTLEAPNIDLASILQHEIDHLDGLLYTSRMAPDQELLHWDSPPMANM